MEGIDHSIFVELHKKSLKAPSENLNKKLGNPRFFGVRLAMSSHTNMGL